MVVNGGRTAPASRRQIFKLPELEVPKVWGISCSDDARLWGRAIAVDQGEESSDGSVPLWSVSRLTSTASLAIMMSLDSVCNPATLLLI